MALSKSDRRAAAIRKGSSAGSSLGEKAAMRAAIAERHAELSSADHVDTGAADGAEIQRRAELAESMAAEDYSPPDESRAETFQIEDHDYRHVPVSMLLSQLRAVANQWTRGYSKDERLDLATDALLILCRWTSQGETLDEYRQRRDCEAAEGKMTAPYVAPINLGAAGELPLRCDWLDSDARAERRYIPSAAARKAMRAAILQAARDRNADHDAALQQRAKDDGELPAALDSESSAASLGAMALRQWQTRAETAPSLPDADCAELWRDALGVTLSAARTLVARAYRLAPPYGAEPTDSQLDQLAELWSCGRQRAKQVLSSGGKELLERYPEPRELLEALESLAPRIREQLATIAYQRLTDLRDGYATGPRAVAAAERAVNEWRAAVGALPMERRAVELSAQQRCGAKDFQSGERVSCANWTPEPISATAYLLRLLRAEQRRAKTSATVAGSNGARLRCALADRIGGPSVAELSRLAPSAALYSSTYGRRRLYERCAVTDRATRTSV